jgi:hypothetical protein
VPPLQESEPVEYVVEAEAVRPIALRGLSMTWGQGDEFICALGRVQAWWAETGGGAQSGFPFVVKHEQPALFRPQCGCDLV